MFLLNKFINKKTLSFGAVGVFNTLVDYGIFNVLVLIVGARPFVANFISTSIALSISYFLNKRFVFKHAGTFDIKSATLFLGFTAFGLWIIQGIGLSLMIHIVQNNAPDLYLNHEFIVVNAAKLISSIGSILWNYLTYNHFVFKTHEEPNN